MENDVDPGRNAYQEVLSQPQLLYAVSRQHHATQARTVKNEASLLQEHSAPALVRVRQATKPFLSSIRGSFFRCSLLEF